MQYTTAAIISPNYNEGGRNYCWNLLGCIGAHLCEITYEGGLIMIAKLGRNPHTEAWRMKETQ